jgi:hypothetical protein
MKLKPFHRSRIALLATTACAALALPAMAGQKTKPSKEVIVPAEESHVHFLFKVEFANSYITPRGMIVHDEGMAIQPLFLMFVDLYKGDGFIHDVKLVAGVWNDLTTNGVSENAPFGSNPKTNWVEIDPILGVSMGLGKHFTLDVTYTAFAMQILSIGTSQHLETKLSFDDTDYLGAWAMHPYFSYWQELDQKATAAQVPQAVLGASALSGKHSQPGSSHYFEFGIAPSYTFKNAGNLKVEAPCRVLFPDSRFYGEYYGSSSVVGLFELGMKATLPLPNMPKGYGNWATYAGFKYQYYVDKNIAGMNAFNAPGSETRDAWGFYGGFSVFF